MTNEKITQNLFDYIDEATKHFNWGKENFISALNAVPFTAMSECDKLIMKTEKFFIATLLKEKMAIKGISLSNPIKSHDLNELINYFEEVTLNATVKNESNHYQAFMRIRYICEIIQIMKSYREDLMDGCSCVHCGKR
jgi:hypothetical protein